VANVKDRLAVNKQRFDMERFNHNTLNDVEGKEKFRVGRFGRRGGNL
jgi:hypothetical protein